MSAEIAQPAPASGTAAATTIKVACRNSKLALVQAHSIVATLQAGVSSSASGAAAVTFDISTKTVAGDADKVTPFLQLSKATGGSDVGKSLWTTGLEEDLVAGKTHVLVHCLKDMPTTLPQHCLLAAVAEREDPTDAFVVSPNSPYKSIDDLPAGSIIGSSSSRRKALIKRSWPHLVVEECRGNLDSRLAKLDAPDSKFSAIILASAGLLRLNLAHRITHRLTGPRFPYAVGQGALALETRDDAAVTIAHAVQHADHKPSRWRGLAERAMLRRLQGGCSSPVGCETVAEPLSEGGEGVKLKLSGTVLSVDGSQAVDAEETRNVGSDAEAEELGYAIAQALLQSGADKLLVRPT